MYDYIEGDMVTKTPAQAVVAANGVGYRFTIPISTYDSLPDSGRIRLLAYLYVREDTLRLYGFAAEKERRLFTRLLSVSGVGPALAIAALNGISVDEFRQAVASEDVATLSRVKGVGRKTAERIIVEMKREMERELMQDRAEGREASVAVVTTDAVAAMLALGYTRSSAEAAVGRALAKTGRDAGLEQVVREALQQV